MAEGQRLEEYLRLKKISQTFFGELIGASKSAVNKWIKNDALPNGSQLKQILINYPDLNIRWWITGEGEMIQSADRVNTLTDRNILTSKIGELVLEVEVCRKEKKELENKVRNEVEVLKLVARALQSLFSGEELEAMLEEMGDDGDRVREVMRL